MFKKIFVYGGFNLATLALGVVTLPVLTSYMSVEEYGVLGLMLSVIPLILVFIGFSNEGNIQANKLKLNPEDYESYRGSLSSVNLINFLISIVATFTVCLYLDLTCSYLVIPFLCLIRTLRVQEQSELVVLSKDFSYGLVNFLVPLLSFIFSLLIFELFYSSAEIRMIGFLMAEILVVIFFLRPNMEFCFSKFYFLDLFRYGLPLVLSIFPVWAINESGKFFLLGSQGADAVGIYTLSFQLAALYLQFNNSVGNAFAKKLYVEFPKVGVPYKIYIGIFMIQVLCIATYVIFLNFLGKFFLPEAYWSSIDNAYILLLGVMFQSFGMVPTFYFSYVNKNKFRLYALLIGGIVVLTLNALFGFNENLRSVSLAFVVGMLCYACVMNLCMFHINYKMGKLENDSV